METPDPPSDTPGDSKQVVLTPHDIPRSLRADFNIVFSQPPAILQHLSDPSCLEPWQVPWIFVQVP